ncbi:Extracellular superoxide dismutase [Cu-Zn] [Schistosoma japonicum]|nr:Extracellular superoxide dismutase [Cu-Zn] [Schistosoma japonicum]
MNDHGGLTGSPRHPGDFGNLHVDHNGVMTFHLSVDISEIIHFDGFLGRALVIHEKEDDLGKTNNDGSRKTGNSGKRLTCAVIGIWRA